MVEGLLDDVKTELEFLLWYYENSTKLLKSIEEKSSEQKITMPISKFLQEVSQKTLARKIRNTQSYY